MDPDIQVSAEDLIALRQRAARLRPVRRQPARSALAGAHRSRFRGRGMDYRESRHYQAGDDIRNMDWRITARAGHPHIKVFDEERERPVVVLADFGPSMFFASQGAFKSVVAARLAALIGWSAIGHGDRIGALLFNGEHKELQPAGGRRGQMRLIRALTEAGDPARGLAESLPSDGGQSGSGPFGGEPSGVERSGDEAAETHRQGALTEALARLRRVARPGSLVFLISDFYSMDAGTARLLARLAEHSDLTAFQIVDALELAPPPPGRYGISDGRRRGLFDAASARQRARYQDYFQRHHAAVRLLVEGSGAALLRCTTTDAPDECLAAALALRGRQSGAAVA
ncbi:DUF58 domain-containing protein [Thiohalocapsa marina]|uniref:DUF58 domain-containing protein n=1 Tax=Thiohalocapsa marina TaxID=424902 RepID=A0A5M8FH28_9GAMM|nr:DUF58 domain-containing protein [Thiohalocapsa marina]KAA6184027.1 DUF58 domain-containing protein [Thiohalocapsa marina]